MDNLSLEVEARSETGKAAARRLRRSGMVPGVVYGILDSTPLTIDPKALEEIIGTRAGTNAIIQLNVAGEKKSDRPVLVKELQRDAMSDKIVHADFLEIRMDQKIKVDVPFRFDGESPGVKMGGVLSVLLRELAVECLPNAIPEEILIDVSELEVGDVIHIRDVTLPGEVDLSADPDDPIVTVIVPVEEEEEVPEEVEGEEGVVAEGEEGEAAAAEGGAAEGGAAEGGDAKKKDE